MSSSLTPPLVASGPELTDEQRVRYARHLVTPALGEEGQRRLLGARVAVLGTGGLGSPVLTYLVAAGVGHITIIDDDVVELSNLNRQVLHDTWSLGTPKVDSAARRLSALNPDVELTVHRVRLTDDNADHLLGGHHLVVDCADNFPTRYVIADACERLGVPHVWAALLHTQGQLSVFTRRRADADGPVAGVGLRDVFPTPPRPEDLPPGPVGILGPLCGQVGSMVATEAIKMITGMGRPLIGRVAFVDVLAPSVREVAVRPAPDAVPGTVTT